MPTSALSAPLYPMRRLSLLAVFGLASAVLAWRVLDLQVLDPDFLRKQADVRHIRTLNLPANRGTIFDRNGEPLAISTQVRSVSANPRVLSPDHPQLPRLASLLDMPLSEVRDLLASKKDKGFIYLARQVSPERAARIDALDLPGIDFENEYRRFFPASEIFGHVIGFTNIEDRGQEGVERAFDASLRGVAGERSVVRDGNRRVIAISREISQPYPGHDLTLSLDRRLQYLAYQGLAEAVRQNRAKAGSLVLMDVRNGEVLAMVNQPAYNPNNRGMRTGDRFRNRAITDTFEPGSTIKPFTIGVALESGRYTPHTPINTGDGWMQVGNKRIRDIGRYGLIDVAAVIRKSSNVGATKIALSLPREDLWGMFHRVGFNQATGAEFPGEALGRLEDVRDWVQIEHATLAYGYGLSVTPLQLTRAYAAIGAGGVLYPASLLKHDSAPAGERVIDKRIADQLLEMMEGVVGEGGTAPEARVPGYRIAGKTGTVHKAQRGGYAENRYLSVFAGIAPVSEPRLAMVVLVDEPKGEEHYGGKVAAPVFSKVMEGALRLLNVAPDDLASLRRDPRPEDFL
ncbi:MAG: penicillin-binding protein 2 [Chromatiales bacterium]|nr:penicillin-binding protein 2 [Chromatiales bacterium]